jgi:hypothetical protein
MEQGLRRLDPFQFVKADAEAAASPWGIRTRNSWSSTWGIGGNCIIPEGNFGDQQGWFAIRSVKQTPTTFPAPKAISEATKPDYSMAP